MNENVRTLLLILFVSACAALLPGKTGQWIRRAVHKTVQALGHEEIMDLADAGSDGILSDTLIPMDASSRPSSDLPTSTK